MTLEVTDIDFEKEVLERSENTPVVVDLWAPWCGPCKSLGPILERVIEETEGKVILVKVNIDENPGVAGAFKVQSIPAVFAIHNKDVVSSFVGAQGEEAVRDFVQKLLPSEEMTELEKLINDGDELSLRKALEIEADNPTAVTSLAQLLVTRNEEGDKDEAIKLLEKISETPETRRVLAIARLENVEDIDSELTELIERVKTDEDARDRFIDLLELLGPEDPRTSEWRQRLTSALF
ncbi:MAG: tetratricopeptide repeat protein [Acidimicrobiales bacterium]|nr:co-chaperone YbbN [Acidimicrobiaceae bacterium]MDG2352561.1 tetratricopeptide repeat protein [Acidimicrobiales bacterium]MDP6161938.1 tetratricopeptide repeat protein [Acidimicrobiales bacterium]HJO40731.1 tetratricopeptide repeat protein [Acidimicrobiales bacterium]